MDGPAESPTIGWHASAATEIMGFPNILRIICASLVSKKDMLSMAVLCKAASSIALDEIWRSRSSMAQLLAPLFCNGFISTLTPKLLLCRSITSQDPTWTRFCDYTNRIRMLTVRERFFEQVHHGTMLQLMQLAGSQPMFPHLLNLDVSGDEDGTVVSDLPLFVSPALSLVSIQIKSGERDARTSTHIMESFLVLAQEKEVPLEKLFMVAKIPVSISTFFSTLSRSNTLRILHLEGIRCLDADEPSCFTNLGLLEGLEELRLVAEEDKSNRVPVEAFRTPNGAGQENLTTQPEASTVPGPPRA
ncbi:hypothetical protein BKA70DRAFT_677679 [Coprinopsis sp. MPI-PUGE-AT-0042]|nr:hypothetical protein BKA70DRAFT_677679 [Coprinopsis sp. MPI-PUGE-AT-0042]